MDLITGNTFTIAVATISKLEELGFSATDCEKALEATEGRLDDAATWLTQYAEPMATSSKKAAEKEKDKDGFKISGFEVKCRFTCVDVILKEHVLHVKTFLKVNSNTHFML